MSLENAKPIALGIAELDEEIKALTAKKKELEAELRPLITDVGPVQFDEFIFECKTVPGRKTLDKDLLMQTFSLPDLSDFEKTGKPFTTMTIKKVTVA